MVLALNVQFLMAMLHLKKKKMIVASMGVFFFYMSGILKTRLTKYCHVVMLPITFLNWFSIRITIQYLLFLLRYV